MVLINRDAHRLLNMYLFGDVVAKVRFQFPVLKGRSTLWSSNFRIQAHRPLHDLIFKVFLLHPCRWEDSPSQRPVLIAEKRLEALP